MLGREVSNAFSTGLRYLPRSLHVAAEEAKEEETLQHSHAVVAGVPSVAAVAAAKSVRLVLELTLNVALTAGSTAKAALGMRQSLSTKALHWPVSTSPLAGFSGKRSVKGLCTAG